MNVGVLVDTYGYIMVAFFVTIEGLGVPVPGELALLTAAAFAATGGHLSLTGIILASWIGTILGGSGGYWIGRTGGLAIIQRHGHLVGLTPPRVQHAQEFFEDHGAKTIVVARFIAVLRVVAGIFAGVAQMRFVTFALYNAIGGLLWSVAFGVLGYEFGQRLPLLERYLREVTIVAAGIVAVMLIVWWWRRRQRV